MCTKILSALVSTREQEHYLIDCTLVPSLERLLANPSLLAPLAPMAVDVRYGRPVLPLMLLC